jgi:heterodisulfide reductase subunit B
VRVRHPLDLFVEEVGLAAIASKVSNPLGDLRVACYYGCYLSRPPELTGYTRPFRPRTLDTLADTLGAQPLPFRQKARCCGGPQLQNNPQMASALTRDLLEEARSPEADCLLSVCPLCSLMLDAHQPTVQERHGEAFDLPVLYFTQLMGLAFGLTVSDLGLNANVVSTQRICERCHNRS